MIVFDASTLVSAAFRRAGVPALAVRHALRHDRIAISGATLDELRDVLHRPRLARFIDPLERGALLGQLQARAARFTPVEAVTDCRDPKDNKYLELALAAQATILVNSDDDLLTLHPWRGIPIQPPAAYLAGAEGQ